jgi:hypothetical protein
MSMEPDPHHQDAHHGLPYHDASTPSSAGTGAHSAGGSGGASWPLESPNTAFHTPHEYPSSYPPWNALPMEPLFQTSAMPPAMSSSMPPPQQLHQRPTYHQLQPLITPQAQPPWPSMLASQSSYASPLQGHPLGVPLAVPQRHGASTPRKTLTDADRRRMCLYAEEHPTVKQTEIGGELIFLNPGKERARG